MEIELKENVKENINLEKAHNNYCKIINKHLPYKFSYLDEWTLKKSKLLLDEADKLENKIEKNFRVYKRGTIIKVDFGIGIGSEISQVHFAIVLNNFDNQKSNVLTVIPLTSKENHLNLNLDELIIEKLINKVKKEIVNIEFDEKIQNIDSSNETKLNKLNKLLSYYKNNIKNTYACWNLITTISKSRILPPINEYDIIGRERCSKEVMDKIDNMILKQFTKTI